MMTDLGAELASVTSGHIVVEALTAPTSRKPRDVALDARKQARPSFLGCHATLADFYSIFGEMGGPLCRVRAPGFGRFPLGTALHRPPLPPSAGPGSAVAFGNPALTLPLEVFKILDRTHVGKVRIRGALPVRFVEL